MPSIRSGASYKPSSSSQKGHRRDYGRSQSDTEGQGSVKDFHNSKLSNSEADDTILHSKIADTPTRSLSGLLQSQQEGLQQFTAAQRVPDPFQSVEKLHELIPDCGKIPGSSQPLQIAQWMASINGEEKHDAFDTRMEEKQPSTTKASAKKAPVASSSNINVKTSHKLKTSGKGKHQPHSLTARATGLQRFKRMPWKMYFRWPEP
ncbi:hypothetical protein O181_106283 [Austropuccinia psidii MF-1]|uniref:Uncharacterized protein n=1 Tax=Austropuccinia psidii MF-1 TaxID=1389203 RepID=A0A9Q3PLT9_9BASI|nr:hypothetical protein [Austropuccinia psidii MF-1]